MNSKYVKSFYSRYGVVKKEFNISQIVSSPIDIASLTLNELNVILYLTTSSSEEFAICTVCYSIFYLYELNLFILQPELSLHHSTCFPLDLSNLDHSIFFSFNYSFLFSFSMAFSSSLINAFSLSSLRTSSSSSILFILFKLRISFQFFTSGFRVTQDWIYWKCFSSQFNSYPHD